MPRPRGEYGFTVPEAGAMVGLSPGSSYKAARLGEIPTVRIGALLIVPRVVWLRMLGFEGTEDPAKGPAADPMPLDAPIGNDCPMNSSAGPGQKQPRRDVAKTSGVRTPSRQPNRHRRAEEREPVEI